MGWFHMSAATYRQNVFNVIHSKTIIKIYDRFRMNNVNQILRCLMKGDERIVLTEVFVLARLVFPPRQILFLRKDQIKRL